MLRPGLVFGVDAGGLFGAIARATARHALMPMVGSGWQRLFMTHDRSLCELVSAIVAGDVQPDRPLFAAHEVPTTLRGIALRLAHANGRDLRVISVAPSLAYLGPRCAELARLPLSFRSDSLHSLSPPIPLDQVAALARGPRPGAVRRSNCLIRLVHAGDPSGDSCRIALQLCRLVATAHL